MDLAVNRVGDADLHLDAVVGVVLDGEPALVGLVEVDLIGRSRERGEREDERAEDKNKKKNAKNSGYLLHKDTPFGNWLPYPFGFRPFSFAPQPFGCFAFIV